MTPRGRAVLALGVVVYIAAWAFGSKPLYPVAAGLLVVSALAWVWIRIGTRTFRLQRRTASHDLVEGDDATIRLKLEPVGRLPLAAVEIVERIEGLGEQRHLLRRFGGALRIDYTLRNLRRGRYAYEGVYAELSDPFGLQRVRVALPVPGALLVYPRIVALEGVFSDAGSHGLDGARVLLRRHSGFDLHSVREHVEGESLRRVHWPSTARRARLMVRELEETPRDETAVLLDTDERAVAGDSFDAQVRAAASILAAHVARGRRAVISVNSTAPIATRVHGGASDWRGALDVLAAVQPGAGAPLAEFLRVGAGLRALELTVVTSRLDELLVANLVQRMLSRRRVSLVYVDAPTFVGASPGRLPELLRLSAAGVPIAVVRSGADLRHCLERQPAAEVARA